jgi:hypothetical protein
MSHVYRATFIMKLLHYLPYIFGNGFLSSQNYSLTSQMCWLYKSLWDHYQPFFTFASSVNYECLHLCNRYRAYISNIITEYGAPHEVYHWQLHVSLDDHRRSDCPTSRLLTLGKMIHDAIIRMRDMRVAVLRHNRGRKRAPGHNGHGPLRRIDEMDYDIDGFRMFLTVPLLLKEWTCVADDFINQSTEWFDEDLQEFYDETIAILQWSPEEIKGYCSDAQQQTMDNTVMTMILHGCGTCDHCHASSSLIKIPKNFTRDQFLHSSFVYKSQWASSDTKAPSDTDRHTSTLPSSWSHCHYCRAAWLCSAACVQQHNTLSCVVNHNHVTPASRTFTHGHFPNLSSILPAIWSARSDTNDTGDID